MTDAPAQSPPDRSPLTSDELATIRAALPAVRSSTYLNAGTLGPLPQAAIDAMRTESRLEADRRQFPGSWQRLFDAQDAARSVLAELTGASIAQIALMHSTHEAINACLWGLDPTAGDSFVTLDEEHPGLLIPLRHVRDRRGCELRTASWVDDDAAFVDGVRALADSTTRAVLVSHVSWVTGRIAPIRRLREALPTTCRLIVDGAQSAGIVPIDPDDGWDAYTVSGQKWPCGPNGSGGVALADPEAWAPTYGAFMQVEAPANCLTSPLATTGRRLEMSQEAIVPLAGLAASLRWLLDTIGIGRAHAHAQALNTHLRARVASDAAITAALACEPIGDAHLCYLELTAPVAERVATTLADRGVSIRCLGAHRLRVSLGPWNGTEDVERLAGELVDVLAHSG